MTYDERIAEMYRHGEAMGKHIQSLVNTKPFRPFIIHMTGKSTYEITDPSMIEVRQYVAEVRPGSKNWALLALEHVVSLTVHPPVDEPVMVEAKNDQQKR